MLRRFALPTTRPLLTLLLFSLPLLLANGQEIQRLASLNLPQPSLENPSLPANALSAEHPIDPALRIALDSLQHVQTNVHDYTALFVKRCRVDGDLPPLQYASMKIRNRKIDAGAITTPLSVYLDFLKPTSVKGREVIWVEGANDGNMLVHQGGFASFLTTRLDPEGMLAMRGQRYSIKEIGIENLLHKIIQTAQLDRQHGECEVHIHHNEPFGKTRCTVVDITHPQRRDHFRFHRAKVYFDDSSRMPIRYQAWLWPEASDEQPVLDEEYNYFNLAVNVGLSDEDFLTSNPAYRF